MELIKERKKKTCFHFLFLFSKQLQRDEGKGRNTTTNTTQNKGRDPNKHLKQKIPQTKNKAGERDTHWG